jgi:hypothetical protein
MTLNVARYQVDWYTDYGIRKNVIQAFNKLEYARAENQVGSMILTLPLAHWNYEDFKVGDILEIWREKSSRLELQNETAYFVQNWRFYTDSNGTDYVQILANDANWLLDTAIVANYAGSPQASKTNQADDMMKEIVKEQLGTAGARYKLAYGPDLTLAPSMTKAFSRRNVLKVIQEIAEASKTNGTNLYFDVVRLAPGQFEFQTFINQRGINHGRESGDIRLVGRDYGNLFEASFSTMHSEERNYIYVGGKGEGAERVIVERSNAARMASSKWNRRELFVDARDLELVASLQAEGDAALAENKPKQIMTGKLVDIPGMRYGIEYGFGDVLTVQAFGYQVDCHVTNVGMSFSQDKGEALNIYLQGEL